MMIAALLALLAGATAGIFLATRHFMRKGMPAWAALLHGIGGATGLTLVLVTAVLEPGFRPARDTLYLLIVTVVLGAVNLTFHLRRVRHRTSLIMLHGLTAVASAALLIRAIWLHGPGAEQASAATPAQRLDAISAAEHGAPTQPLSPQGANEPAPATPQAPAPSTVTDATTGNTARGDLARGDLALSDDVKRTLDQTILFEDKSATIRSDSLATIAQIAGVLKAHPEISLLEIQGHADERGDEAHNIALTRSRAESVVSSLITQGVARERLHSAGYGARCPEDAACRGSNAPASCHAASSWQHDRRVVVRVLQVGTSSFHGDIACVQGADLIPPSDRRFHTSSD